MSKLLEFFRLKFNQPSQPDQEEAGLGAAIQQEYAQHRHATADFTEAEDDDDDTNDEERHTYSGQQHGLGYEDRRLHSSDVLPLFSLSHLGIAPTTFPCTVTKGNLLTSSLTNRLAARLQHNPCHTSHCADKDRDHLDMGPAPVSAGVSVSGEADAAADPSPAFLSGNSIRAHGQLPPVCKGRTNVSRKRGYQ